MFFLGGTFLFSAIFIGLTVDTHRQLPERTHTKRLVLFANKVRNLQELGLVETVSTRLLVHTAKLIGDGLPPRLACEVGILNPLTDDPEILKNLKDIVALFF
jgi:hypothetical protein